MKYLLMHKTDGTQGTPEMLQGIVGLMEEQSRQGVLLAAEGIDPRGGNAKLTFKDGKRITTDAPFAEAKEVVGGFAIVQARSLEEAIELASRFGAVCTNATEVEVHQIADFGDGQ